ncbi:cytochrome b [Sphingomonas sp. UNC305MFCol5.2]|uniref:cytochrome b n=1 Tax=Sphingomonas sp. UNC305MFCol5.2 TaxID=1449076 RepID=UPI00042093E3|nr:cytochrome b [Sphingomonas sp. UNC305MFCol5.2]
MLPRGGRYDRGAIAFHWTTAALVLVNLFLGLFHESLLEGIRVIPTHKAIGATVLVLSLGRLGWRLTHRPPHFPENMKAAEKALAKAVHWLFYALLIALPLTGWMFTSNPARPRPVSWFGLFDLPLLPMTRDIAVTAHDVHEALGLLMAGLVVLHVAAALRHHFLLRDRVLARMLPWAARNG